MLSIFHKLRLLHLIRASKNKSIRQFYRSQIALLNQPINKTKLLAVDLEMTGLSASKDHVISMGWVPIDEQEIHLNKACYYLIKSSKEVGDSATIHGITDREKSQGVPIKSVYDHFIQACQQRILVVHCAAIDVPFLNRISKTVYASPFKPLVIDTMALEKEQLMHRNTIIQQNDLQLSRCRQNYKLPNYQGHNAMSDALATAELLLAIISEIGDSKISSLI